MLQKSPLVYMQNHTQVYLYDPCQMNLHALEEIIKHTTLYHKPNLSIYWEKVFSFSAMIVVIIFVCHNNCKYSNLVYTCLIEQIFSTSWNHNLQVNVKLYIRMWCVLTTNT